MEFRKMLTITLYTRQQKRHRCIEQSFGLCGRGRGWDDLGEWHWNMYNIRYETSHQSRFDARDWMGGAGALGRPRGMVGEGRREEGSGWETRVYQWQIHVDIWQNQYNIVKLKNKIKYIKKKKKKRICLQCRKPRFDPWVGKISWRREWLSTPIFLPGEFHGQRSLVGYSQWGCRVRYTFCVLVAE